MAVISTIIALSKSATRLMPKGAGQFPIFTEEIPLEFISVKRIMPMINEIVDEIKLRYL